VFTSSSFGNVPRPSVPRSPLRGHGAGRRHRIVAVLIQSLSDTDLQFHRCPAIFDPLRSGDAIREKTMKAFLALLLIGFASLNVNASEAQEKWASRERFLLQVPLTTRSFSPIRNMSSTQRCC